MPGFQLGYPVPPNSLVRCSSTVQPWNVETQQYDVFRSLSLLLDVQKSIAHECQKYLKILYLPALTYVRFIPESKNSIQSTIK